LSNRADERIGRHPRGFVRACLCLLVVVLALGLAGCWNRRELESLSFVSAAGVDVDSSTGLIHLTVHVLKPHALGDAGQVEKGLVQVVSTGRTVFEAVRNVIQQLPMRLFWAHNNALVIGEETARAGTALILDFFVRDGETRHDVAVMVAEGTTANEFLKIEYELDPQVGMALHTHIQSARNSLSTTVAPDLHEFTILLESPGAQPLATRVSHYTKQPGDPVGELLREEITHSPLVGGAAVFRGDRLVGWLEPLETRGLLWIKGEVRSGILVVPDPWQEGRQVGLELYRNISKVKFSVDSSGRLSAKVDIQAHAYLGDAQTPLDPLKMSDFERLLQDAYEAEIRAEANSALARCQKEFRSDVFGFGSALHRQKPAVWKQIKDQWDEIFPELEVEVTVRGRLLRSGTNTSVIRSR
jgi:spore germination protein KC